MSRTVKVLYIVQELTIVAVVVIVVVIIIIVVVQAMRLRRGFKCGGRREVRGGRSQEPRRRNGIVQPHVCIIIDVDVDVVVVVVVVVVRARGC